MRKKSKTKVKLKPKKKKFITLVVRMPGESALYFRCDTLNLDAVTYHDKGIRKLKIEATQQLEKPFVALGIT